MTVMGMLIYSVLIILHYYFIIISYYDNIILSYHYIILAQYNIYWHFSNQGFCSRMAPYQWFWIIEDCFRHRISARIFSMLEKHSIYNKQFGFFWAQALGPGPMVQGPWSPWGPPPFFSQYCKMVRDLSRSVPRVFRSLGKPLIKLFRFIFNSKCHFLKVICSI